MRYILSLFILSASFSAFSQNKINWYELDSSTKINKIFPFKREDWEMKIEVDEGGIKRDTSLKFFLTNAYARIFHRKKKYK